MSRVLGISSECLSGFLGWEFQKRDEGGVLLPKDDDTKVFLYEMCRDDWSIAAIG